MSTRAQVAKWRREFDPAPYIEALGGTRLDNAGMFKLPSGRMGSISTDRPNKVSVLLHDPWMQRTFGAKQVDAIKEWVASGGTIAKEEKAKRIRAAAPAMYEAIQKALKQNIHHPHCAAHPTKPGSLSAKCECALADLERALALAEGKPQ